MVTTDRKSQQQQHPRTPAEDDKRPCLGVHCEVRRGIHERIHFHVLTRGNYGSFNLRTCFVALNYCRMFLLQLFSQHGLI